MLGLVGLVALTFAGTAPSQDDWRWLDEHREAAFQALMPVPRDSASLVVYRSYRDAYPGVPEAYFEIREATTLEASLVVPLGASVQQQLLNMHIGDPGRGLQALLADVRVSRRTLTASTCPAIQRQLERLGKLRFGVPDRQVIIIHPDRHRVVVDVGGGSVDAMLYEDEHPLVTWSLETLEALKRCRAE